jgi:hypothetical protein
VGIGAGPWDDRRDFADLPALRGKFVKNRTIPGKSEGAYNNLPDTLVLTIIYPKKAIPQINATFH